MYLKNIYNFQNIKPHPGIRPFFFAEHVNALRARQCEWCIHEVVTTKMADFLPSRTAIVCIPNCLLSSGEIDQIRKSKEIDKSLSREKTYVKKLVKILLLGAGESGKSTFLKQMRIIHGQDFDQRAKEEFRATIYSNVIKGTTTITWNRERHVHYWKWTVKVISAAGETVCRLLSLNLRKLSIAHPAHKRREGQCF